MNTLKKVVLMLSLVLAVAVAPAPAQQYTLTSTTLSAAIGPNITSFSVASATNITVNTNTYNTALYVDRELMTVIRVSGTTVYVIRGGGGTQASAHISGAMVLVGNPNAFINYDPEGSCSLTAPLGPTQAVPALPTINSRTGAQYFCGVNGQWVRGFGPQVALAKMGLTTSQTGATITPSGPYFQFSGTTALVTINVPVGASDGDQITIEFTGSSTGLTWTAAGNISVLGTATSALSSVTFTYNSATSKWIPSRVA